MLLVEDHFKNFTSNNFADPHKETEVLLSFIWELGWIDIDAFLKMNEKQ